MFFMVGFFAFQPAVPALANEFGDAETAPVASEVEEAPEPEVSEVSVSEPPAVSEMEVPQPLTVVEEPVLAPEESVVSDTESADMPYADETSSDDDVVSGVETEVPVEPGTVSEPTDPTDSSLTPGSDTGTYTDTDSSADDVPAESSVAATTTVPEPQFLEVTGEVSHTDDVYNFAKSQCLSMGGGAYHCFDPSAAIPTEEADTLYVERDSDGDKEIFLRATGGVEQVTSNMVDDDAPYFDPVSNSIVWHQERGGVYQVMELENGMETVLSEGLGASMEPHRAGRYTVWQSWVDDRWQIVLDDGQGARVISEGPGQHIAPQVEGSYVLWNVTNGDTHTVAVYELATGLVSYIDDSEGARVMNPRFVLVYDTRFDNGDVITKGYDTETGSVVPLAAAAPVQPTEVPSADPTGETRALLQNKTYSRDEFSEGEELGAGGTTTVGMNPVGAATGSTTLAVPPIVEAPALPLTDFDLIVEPYQATSSSQS